MKQHPTFERVPVVFRTWNGTSITLDIERDRKRLTVYKAHSQGREKLYAGGSANQAMLVIASTISSLLACGAYIEGAGLIPVVNKVCKTNTTVDHLNDYPVKTWGAAKMICEAGRRGPMTITLDEGREISISSNESSPVVYVRSELISWIYSHDKSVSAVIEEGVVGAYLLFDVSTTRELPLEMSNGKGRRLAGIGRSLAHLKHNPSKCVRAPGVAPMTLQTVMAAPFAVEVLDDNDDARHIWLAGEQSTVEYDLHEKSSIWSLGGRSTATQYKSWWQRERLIRMEKN